jgi:predicted metal-dependent hydrolase
MVARALPNRMLCLSDRSVPLEIVRHAQAKRLSLRVDPASRQVRLVLPRRAGVAEALAFAERHRSWIEGQLDRLPERVPFEDGQVIPFLGENHTIRHQPGSRRGVWRETGTIRVSGFEDHVPRRVLDFLKREARREIVTRAEALARQVERSVKRITLRDTRTRWGSCSPDGSLNFSWRLVLAPEPVLDYVVAHEVAHLVHMNHGRSFWALVGHLTGDVQATRRWLRLEGNDLHRFG